MSAAVEGNLGWIALYALVLSLVAPVLLFTLMRSLGKRTEDLAYVAVSGWMFFMVAVAAGISGWIQGDELARYVLLASVGMAAALVVPRVVLGPSGEGQLSLFDTPDEKDDELEEEDCSCKSDGEPTGGGEDLPLIRRGESGTIRWAFFVANYYSWYLSINITEHGCGVDVRAVASGQLTPFWHFPVSGEYFEAPSEATGRVWCLRDKGTNQCVAVASGGDDHEEAQDWSSAVSVTEETDAERASLKVTAAVGLRGQVALEQISVKVKAGPASLGANVNLPDDTTRNKAITRTYSYRCV